MTGWDWVIDCKSELGFMGAGVNWGKGNNLARVIFYFYLTILTVVKGSVDRV